MSEQNISYDNIKDLPASSWEKLAQKKIYFGHQSVGYNIMDGVKDLIKEYPQIKLNIIETNDQADFKVGLFAHSGIGGNMNPISKIRDFAHLMDKGLGNNTDFAFFKLCFIDVFPDTDIEKVFLEYKKTMSQLKIKFPKTTFIHVTVPITANLTGANAWLRKTKDFVKKIIGRPVYQNFENEGRNQLNRMIRQEYDRKEALFDIAKIQSTFPNGNRCSYTNDKGTFFSMVEEYTYDGGHLNETGRKKVAEQLLILLANLN